MTPRDTPRASDERTLQWLAWAALGYSRAQIAAHASRSKAYVDKIICMIRDADLDESGECPRVVRAAYGRGKRGRG
jgi:hypothetical protein